MENDKRSFFATINPENMRFTLKLLVMLLVIVIFAMISYFTVGLGSLRHTIYRTTADHLEELTYTKAAEVENNISGIRSQLLEMAGQEKVRRAAEELSVGLNNLPEEKFEFFSGEMKDKIHTDLGDYYSTLVADNSPVTGEAITDLLPDDPKTIALQYLYLVQNPKSYPEKEHFVISDDYSSYSRAHGSYHPYLLEMMQKLNATDLYLADPKDGYIVYSVKKNIDFGSNLLAGKMKKTPLAESFLKALALEQPETVFVDFSQFQGAGDKPVMFVSVPVFFFKEIVGVIIVQFDNKLFDNLLFDDNFYRNISSLDYNIIGTDFRLRNNPKDFLIDQDKFERMMLGRLRRNEVDRFRRVARTGSLSCYLGFPADQKNSIFNGEVVDMKDYRDRKVVACSKKLAIKGVDLFLLTKIDKQEVLSPVKRQKILFLAMTAVVLLIAYLIGIIFGRPFAQRLEKLLGALNLLRNGEKSKQLKKGPDDELGKTIIAYNNLRERIINAEEFALEMSEGNYDYKFNILSDRDSLGKSLNVLKEKLIQSREEHEIRTQEDEIRNWINTGIAKFNDLLRQNNDNLGTLAYSLIENLVNYLGANIGGIYIVEGENEEDKVIELIASYAYDRKKYVQKRLEVREGLLGACYMEKKSIYLKQIPEDYIEIISGLGHNVPKTLYIVPLKLDDNVLGMIEIASLNEIEGHQIEFVDKVAESIAATFVSVQLNMKTSSLLEESRRRAEENAQQEEEMRQNMEEMQATQEELARLRQEDEKRTREMQLVIDNTRATLKNLLDEIPGGYNLKDPNGVIHLINAEGATYYNLSPDKVLGKTDHELLMAKLYDREHKYDLQVIEKGELEYTEKVEIKGTQVEYRVVKKPFMMSEFGQNGILTMRFQVG